MNTGDPRLEQLAADVLDGRPVDWLAAESAAGDAQRDLIDCLKTVAAVADAHRPPDCWGHLQLLEHLGSGASGDVYRAWDSRLDRDVALKLVPAHADGAPSDASSIIREGRLLARVSHPNIVTIHGAERIGDRTGLWMELVRGRTLEQLLLEGARLSAAEVIAIGAALCSAIAAVHAAGVIHRDIKTHNVMLTDEGRVVLMDFGAGRELADGSSTDLTGTPLYVAPEVLAGQPATVRSDIYSLGVLLFHLLTGSYPVTGRALTEIRSAHDANRRTSVRDARPDVPSVLAAVIDRALRPAPEERFADAASFAAALRNVNHPSGKRWLTRWALAAAAAAAMVTGIISSGGPAGVEGAIPAIAVLPFEDHGDAVSDEFADGLSSEIQRSLATVDGLTLRSATSSLGFRSGPRDLAGVASALAVDYVLEGSVAHDRDRLRVDARFTRVSRNDVIWSDSFERDAAALPAIVNEIALAIRRELGLAPGGGQRHYDVDADVYYQFLRARAFQARRGPESSSRAAALFQEVVTHAPEFAPGWAGLASSLAEVSRPSAGEEIIPLDPRIRPAALKAFQLDPLLAEAHAAIGDVFAHDRDWVNARMSFLKAIDLNPSLTDIHTAFVLAVLMPIGDLSESLRQLEAARAADPLSLDVRRIQAHVFVEAGLYDQAIENCLWIKQHDPAFPYVDVWLGRALYLSGRYDEAQQALERAGPDFFGYLGYMLAASGRRAEAEALIASRPGTPSRTMLIHAGLGDRDRAFALLEQTAAINWWRAATWLRRPEMALVRDHPRLPALLQQLGVPQ